MCYRYRLQVKDLKVIPNILGNHFMPVYSYQWRDVAMSNDNKVLEALIPANTQFKYRIEDTERGEFYKIN